MDTVDSGKSAEITIVAQKDGGWAELKLEYSWGNSGRNFSVRTLRYRAADNDRSKGNIKIGLVSKEDTGWVELNNDNGIQDGEWHDFVKTLSADGDAKSADIHFNWIYDQAWPNGDINMTGQKTVAYSSSVAMPSGDVPE